MVSWDLILFFGQQAVLWIIVRIPRSNLIIVIGGGLSNYGEGWADIYATDIDIFV